MKDHERSAPIAQPAEERTADQSTPSASGLTSERPGVNPEHQYEDDQDVVARTDRGEDTPRRYEGDADDEVMPSNDSLLNTKI